MITETTGKIRKALTPHTWELKTFPPWPAFPGWETWEVLSIKDMVDSELRESFTNGQ